MEQAFYCQSCRASLNITGLEPVSEAGGAAKPVGLLDGSVFGGLALDESFVVLDPAQGASSSRATPRATEQTHAGDVSYLFCM